MPLSKKIQNQITVLPDGQLECRETTIIMDNGKELSRSYHRKVIDVGDDVSGECQLVKDTASNLHTQTRIDARQGFKDAQTASKT